ncbi:DNA methyltransferase [Dehalobacter sp.]|uniref:DNA methyltransferase n=1 Tax=Dehalobacter sp. TaxID=1962289 RepID=UPI002583BFA5|nr:DNA methyltransferase [Dehalobacter sp.]MDJ0304736.1 DNA methyltransferase [Dehalobacter sp.]
MERRKLTKADIDNVRNIEGFPIGSDEDIIALSDAPFYTACPNPFIEEFIKENGTPYNEKTDKYHKEPFAADVSEGKSDAIYTAHTYHTKVPYKAIMRYILHYTKPGDIVFDGFAGSGMTGIAAQMCGNESSVAAFGRDVIFGKRKAILSDLSPAAQYITYGYNHNRNVTDFILSAEKAMANCEKECGWMYKTKHTPTGQTFLRENDLFGRINYVVWSDVFVCPNCGEEFVFYNVAYDEKEGKIRDTFVCPKCTAKLKKQDCARAQELSVSDIDKSVVTHAKQTPVLINYVYAGKKYTKKPDKYDFDLIEKINGLTIPYWYPTDKLPDGCNTQQPISSHNFTRVHDFYTKRNLYVLACLSHLIGNSPVRIAFQSMNPTLTSKLVRYNMGNRGNGPLNGTLYVASLVAEADVIKVFKGKVDDFAKVYGMTTGFEGAMCNTASSTSLSNIPEDSIDYIFTDPPFGANLNYSELSFIWETWLKVKTDTRQEAIMNDVQKKGLVEYQQLMTDCFSEFFRILKPDRWMTVEFHNSKNSVWNAIQESLLRAGFIIADVRTLDKQQGSFKQVTTSSAVKQDLVISVYKPKDSFRRDFISHAGSEDTAWSFVRHHLDNLPIAVKRGGEIEVLSERQAFLLWDRMVAYHIMQGIAIPLDATDFYKGLDERFLKRDNMYFLPDQVNEFDLARSTCDIQNIQFSLFVSDEKSAIGWLYQQLDERSGDGPQTYADLMPKFMQECKAVDKREKMPELLVILEENFLKDDDGKWYIPDLTKSGDIARLREKNLLKEFQDYLSTKGKLKVFRSEAIRAGFAKLWKDKDYATIVSVADRLPEETIQEDQNLLMYYDISLGRV